MVQFDQRFNLVFWIRVPNSALELRLSTKLNPKSLTKENFKKSVGITRVQFRESNTTHVIYIYLIVLSLVSRIFLVVKNIVFQLCIAKINKIMITWIFRSFNIFFLFSFSYHYFHSKCFGRYLKCYQPISDEYEDDLSNMNQKKVKKPENVIPCPVCRQDLNKDQFDAEKLSRCNDPKLQPKNSEVLIRTKSLEDLQLKMKTLLENQEQKIALLEDRWHSNLGNEFHPKKSLLQSITS